LKKQQRKYENLQGILKLLPLQGALLIAIIPRAIALG